MSLLRLASNGRTRYQIALSSSATVPERQAARELALHLQAATGARFNTITIERPPDGSPLIAVGPGAAKHVTGRTPSRLGKEGILMQTYGMHLVLAGAKQSKRGTLYAVYAFLEGHLGIRWYTKDVSRIPRQKALRIAPFLTRRAPGFQYREVLQCEAWDEQWATRNRTNGQWEREDGVQGLPPEWGDHCRYAWWVHSFFNMIPPNRYFQDHPEWFSLINGQRSPDAQLCLTNRTLLREAQKQVLKKLREAPEAEFISVSQNDNYGNCQCPDCQSSDAKYRPSGTLLRFINAIADAIATEFPSVKVDTLAYQYTRSPPLNVLPRHNVAIRICTFENDLLRSLDSPNNAFFFDDLKSWATLTPHLTIWDYLTNYAHSIMPFPNWFTMGTNVKILAKARLFGCFLQSNQYSPGGEMGSLRMWVLAQMMWNPRLSPDALIREFLAGVYGKAAKALLAYMHMIHNAALAAEDFPGSLAIQNSIRRSGAKVPPRTGCVLDLNSPVESPFLTDELLCRALMHFEDAFAAESGNPEICKRLQLAQLAVLYPVLLRWDAVRAYAAANKIPWPLSRSRLKICRDFTRICREHHITHLGEAWTRRTPQWLTRVCAGQKSWSEIP